MQLKKNVFFLQILYVYIVKMVGESLFGRFFLPRSGQNEAERRLQV